MTMLLQIVLLLKESADWYRRHFKALAVGAVVIAVLITIIQGIFVSRVSRVIPELPVDLEAMIESMEYMQELETTKEGREELLEEKAEIEEIIVEQEAEILQVFLDFLPAIALTGLASALVFIMGFIYYLLVGLQERTNDIVAALKQVPIFVFPFLFLIVWLLIRSFLWLVALSQISFLFAVAGIIIAFIVLPRLLLSPVLLVRDRNGVVASVRESRRMTDGKWLFIVLLLFVMVVLSLAASYAMLFLALVMGAITTSIYVTLFLQTFVCELIVAFNAVLLIKLTQSMPAMQRKK